MSLGSLYRPSFGSINMLTSVTTGGPQGRKMPRYVERQERVPQIHWHFGIISPVSENYILHNDLILESGPFLESPFNFSVIVCKIVCKCFLSSSL